MKEYSIDTVATGNAKADHINSIIMELAGDIAQEKAEKDWDIEDRGENFYIEEENGDLRMNTEAQDIFNVYYDEETDRLYRLVNTCIEIHESKEI